MLEAKKSSNATILYKHTATVHITNQLSLVERKIYNLLIEKAFKSLLSQDLHQISINDLISGLGHGEKAYKNYEFIKSSLKSLVTNSIAFNILGKDKKNKWDSIVSLLSEVHFKDGIITYAFPQALSMILGKPNIYSTLNLNYQRKFSSKHALALWEFCSEQLSSSKKGSINTETIPLETLAVLLGGTDKNYSAFKDFNRYVIKPSIAEINACTDLIVDYTAVKKGKKVEGISFYVQRKLMHTDEQIPLFPETKNIDIIKYINDTMEGQDFVFKATNLGLDEQFISTISKKFDISALNKALDLLNSKIQNGDQINNVGAYLWSLLDNGIFQESSELSNTDLPQQELFDILKLESLHEYEKFIIEGSIEALGANTARNWISHLKYYSHDTASVTFTAPTNFIKEWIDNNYLNSLLKIWQTRFQDTTSFYVITSKR
ncbi:MAG: RepB family plasmid replication initiator protein [Alphaproteobacteria bacterium]|jgi:plasmid replication initiation protein|nr:RepB family plasmid replication initiator protein [Candidatus Jidaibacter sp.]